MSQEDLATIPDPDGDQEHGEKTLPMCPACGSKLTRRSMRRSWQDRIKSAFGLWPYRCQMCNMRFTGPQEQEAILRHNVAVEAEMRKREAAALALQREEEQASEEPRKAPIKDFQGPQKK